VLIKGVEKIIVNKLNCPPISPAVSKISLGASESVELFSLKFTKNFITDARKSGWKIIATGCDKERSEEKNTEKYESDDEEKGENLSTGEQYKSEKIELKDLVLSKEDNVIAILGSESLGVSQKLLEISNYQVYIPPILNKNMVGKFPYDIVDSLNVGVTTGIILNHIKYLQRKDVKKKEVNKNL
jgi:tRNA G18 (ribose-2'-O)-methylase SpoU